MTITEFPVIATQCIHWPITGNGPKWIAVDDDKLVKLQPGPIGYGTTEHDAINDLVRKIIGARQ